MSKKIVAAIAVLALASWASAAVLVSDFSNFELGGAWGSWGFPGATFSGPTTYDVETYPDAGWGGGWHYNWPPVADASAETDVELQVIIHEGSSEGGAIVALEDGDHTQWVYAWFGLLPGAHTLTKPISSPSWIGGGGGVPGLNLADLQFMQIQGDFNYTKMSWDNLALTPEPASLVIIGLGALLALRRR